MAHVMRVVRQHTHTHINDGARTCGGGRRSILWGCLSQASGTGADTSVCLVRRVRAQRVGSVLMNAWRACVCAHAYAAPCHPAAAAACLLQVTVVRVHVLQLQLAHRHVGLHTHTVCTYVCRHAIVLLEHVHVCARVIKCTCECVPAACMPHSEKSLAPTGDTVDQRPGFQLRFCA
jgi:hypothetical protein